MTTEDDAARAAVAEITERLSPGRRVVEIRKASSQFATTAQLWELEVTVSDGTTLAMIHKASGRRARLPGAPRTIPSFIYDPVREIYVYTNLLNESRLETPILYGSVVQPNRGRYWMFLERVPATQLRWTVAPNAWKRAGSWLARAHTVLRPAAIGNSHRLLVHDAHFYWRWMRRAQMFSDGNDRVRRMKLRWLASHHGAVVDVLTGLPRTIIHGEFYPSNILVDESGPDGRIGVIDWEMAAVGPAVIDVAALTSGTWSASEKQVIVDAYRHASATRVEEPESVGPEALTCARLQLAIQWLGWARGWSPPEEQRHDWLAEAVELGQGMGW